MAVPLIAPTGYPTGPAVVARDRYLRSFGSSIFAPPEEPRGHVAPMGKRRDQTSAELFGTAAQGKNLRYQEGTFEPKFDPRSAAEKKQAFLASAVLPASHHEDTKAEEVPRSPDGISADPVHRRLQENSRDIFAQTGFFPEEKPEPVDEAADEQVHQRWVDNRLCPTSFRWYQYPEKAREDAEEDTAALRALHEKRSHVFDALQPDPSVEHEVERKAVASTAALKAEERELHGVADGMRRNNCYYSDLFGRPTPMDPVVKQDFPKPKLGSEARIGVGADWSDARTEASTAPAASIADRRYREFSTAHVFELPQHKATDMQQDIMDNRQKVVRTENDTNQIHQRHMESSVLGNAFYDKAAQRRAWEVAEVHIAGLSRADNPETVTKKVQRAGFHVVRCAVDMDPVNNVCQGTCKLQIRYNPDTTASPVDTLIRYLEQHGLRAQL